MQVTIGSTNDDRRKLTKSFSGTDVVVQLKSPCDVLAPTFILSYKSAYVTANYVYAPELGRYYFIDNISIAPGAKMEISCSVDVLMTYNSQIKRLSVDVNRQENLIEPYLPDPSYVYLNTYDVVAMLPTSRSNAAFLQSTGTYYFVLGVAGGANDHTEDIDGFIKLTSEPSDWSLRYMFYFVNTSGTETPQMEIIGNLISRGEISASDASSFSTMQTYYGAVYARE